MNIRDYLYNKLKRETSSGNFIAEVDGLRFLAIITVIFYHVQLFFVAKTPFKFNFDNGLHWLIQNGFKGVEIFFVLSGFILALPFANHFLAGSKKPNLKNYYLRRLTRLEPPYFLALILFFILHIIKGVYPVRDLFNGLLFNLAYLQNFTWLHTQPIIGNITWSLEIEVQFYLIMPFLAAIFSLGKLKRRIVLIGAIIVIPIINVLLPTDHVSLYNYLFYFLVGFLIVDLYITEKKAWLNNIIALVAGLIALAAIYLINIDPLFNKLLFVLSIFVFIYLALTAPVWRRVFSNKVLTTVGGMCYTIYLLHTVIISGFGNQTVFWQISRNYELNIMFQILILMPPILIISAVYFSLIEKHCMDKNWPLKLAGKIKLFYGNVKNIFARDELNV